VLHFIEQSGMWGWLLLVLLAVILALAGQGVVRLRRARREEAARTLYGINAIFFWGGVSLLLGFLGQFSGLYLALTSLPPAAKISPSVIAAGFAASLTASTLGLAIFLLSALLWVSMRGWYRTLNRGGNRAPDGMRAGMLGPGSTLPCLAILFLVLCPSPSLPAQETGVREHAIPELQEDFDTLRELLEKNHPDLYLYRDKQTVDAAFDRARVRIDREMNELEFMILLAPVIDQFHCGHTQLAFSREFLARGIPDLKCFPFRLRIIDGKAYVIDNHTEHDAIVKGTEIVAINEERFPRVLERMLRAARADGPGRTGKVYFLNNQPFGLHGIVPERPETYAIRYRRRHGTGTERLTVKARTYRSLYGAFVRNAVAGRKCPFSLKTMDDLGIAVMTVKAFVRTRDCDPFAFLKRSFTEMADRGIENLVIDVRGNAGGEPKYAADLLAYLIDSPFTYFAKAIPTYARFTRPMKPHDTRFKGTVYVLIDGGCFSTTGHFLSLVRHHGLARMIGETSGSSYSCNDNALSATLPHTRIRVRVPRSVFETAVEGFERGKGIRPDHEVKQGIDDFLNGVDTVMEYTLRLIRTRSGG